MISLSLIVDDDIAQSIGDHLIELDALSLSFSDSDLDTHNEVAIFGEDPDDHERYWKNTKVIALFQDDHTITEVINSIHNTFNIHIDQIQVEPVAEKDWVKETQSQFKPIQINDKIWIIPSWHKIKNNSAINIHLDPGLAFGTGSHPTTKLCLDWLTKIDLIDKSVLDYGCGSGILAIAAKKLGAELVAGTDIDPQAITASHQNAENNQTSTINFYTSDESTNDLYDIVVANILSSALKVLEPLIHSKCKPQGRIALSGILQSQENEIKEIYAHNFIFEDSLYQDGWVCMTALRKS